MTAGQHGGNRQPDRVTLPEYDYTRQLQQAAELLLKQLIRYCVHVFIVSPNVRDIAYNPFVCIVKIEKVQNVYEVCKFNRTHRWKKR